jgi:N utilization substance protein A
MSELTNAIKQICEEKSLSYEAVVTTIESALAAAYRKDFGEKNQNAKVQFNPDTGGFKVFDVKTVVEDMPDVELSEEAVMVSDNKKLEKQKNESEEVKSKKLKVKIDATTEVKGQESIVDGQVNAFVASDETLAEEERRFNPRTEIQLKDAVMIGDYKIGDEIWTELLVIAEFGRMAAQTAKQVIIQRLREAERDAVFSNFKEKEGEVVTGVIQRKEGRMVLIDLGKSVGILPPEEQIFGERYNSGDRIKIYIKEVRSGHKGAEVVLSRTSDEILKKIFYLEIPEIANGLVDLKAVAREAGARSKVAVSTESESVDPIGSCVGQRGARIQTVISELGGEKVDIILYDEVPEKFIANALAPAKVKGIKVYEDEKKAVVKVASDQLSLAIGKGGQNARLAARLTGWRIDIVEADTEKVVEITEEKVSVEDSKEETSESKEEEIKEENVKEGGEKVEKPKKETKEKKTKKTKSKKEDKESE